MPCVGSQSGKSYETSELSTAMSKLRRHETLGFRPKTDAQEKLIQDAQSATGIKMSDLLLRAVLRGLPHVVEEIRSAQAQAFEMFDKQLNVTERAVPEADVVYKIKRTKDPPKRQTG